MKSQHHYLFILLIVLAQACDKINPADTEGLSYSLEGNAQKGPFINGSNITIIELDKHFAQTGKSFTTTTGAYGQFEFKDIKLNSQYIEIIADGFYYNEISGDLSNSKLSLNAIADVSDNKTVNANILTHLEFERVKYLIAESKLSIQEAKEQARNEILDIFNFNDFSYEQSEKLNILGKEEGDGILLAISAILQGNNTTARLSLTLADIISDIKTDGLLNDTLILTNLKSQAYAINADKITQDLINHYNDLGLEISETAHFKDYIELFLEDADTAFVSPFTLPATAAYGKNLLDPSLTKIESFTEYSLAAEIPASGSLSVKIKKTGGSGTWYYQPAAVFGWQVSQYGNDEQTFTSTLNNITADMPIEFHADGKAIIEYYYNGSTTPLGTKEIIWSNFNATSFILPQQSNLGSNLLNYDDSIHLGDTIVSIALQKDGLWDISFQLFYSETLELEIMEEYGTCYYYPDQVNPSEIKLSGKNEGDFISEVLVSITGNGILNITTSDMDNNGQTGNTDYYSKTFSFYP